MTSIGMSERERWFSCLIQLGGKNLAFKSLEAGEIIHGRSERKKLFE
jgi:hypothetical protein